MSFQPIPDETEERRTRNILFPSAEPASLNDESEPLSAEEVHAMLSISPTPSLITSASSITSIDFENFVHTIPYTLTFSHINYPDWAREPTKPLPYEPMPVAQLPDIPSIPNSEFKVPLTQILDLAGFVDTIDGILHVKGYNLNSDDVYKVFVSYTFPGGKRMVRHPVSLMNADLLLKPVARDIYRYHLDPTTLTNKRKRVGPEPDSSKGQEPARHQMETHDHRLEVDVVFDQGTELLRKDAEEWEQYEWFGDTPKLVAPLMASLQGFKGGHKDAKDQGW